MLFHTKNCRACGEVVSKPQLGFLGCRILGAGQIGVILGPSRAMVGHAEAICQMLFGHVVGFVSQRALPQKHQSGFWQAMLDPLWATCKDQSNILGPDWGQVWPSWALFRVSGSYSSASCGKVGGS